MITLRNAIEVRRPVDAVYDFLVNLENVPKWQPAVIETKRLTEGPIRVGTQFREVAKLLGKTRAGICEITRLEPGRVMAFESPGDPFAYAATYTLEPRGETTRIEIVGTFTFKGWWRWLEPIAGLGIRMESKQELAAMKAAIERT